MIYIAQYYKLLYSRISLVILESWIWQENWNTVEKKSIIDHSWSRRRLQLQEEETTES